VDVGVHVGVPWLEVLPHKELVLRLSVGWLVDFGRRKEVLEE